MLPSGRLHDRQVSRLGALEDATNIDADLTISAQTTTLIGAETDIKTIAAVHSQCPSRVIKRLKGDVWIESALPR
jgi:hypothetical protein